MPLQIETRRLIIRDLEKSDIGRLLEFYTEPVARSGILQQHGDQFYNKYELENAVTWATSPYQRQYYELAVLLKSDQTLIGTCSLYGVYPESLETGLGWHYQSPYWGKGFATEAAREQLYIGFELNRVELIYADCFTDNIASIRIMEKLGMTPKWNSGLAERIDGNGRNKPTVRYQIGRKEWLNQTG